MGFSITPEIWFFVRIMTQDFTKKAQDAAEQVLTFSIQKISHAPVERSSYHYFPYYKTCHVLRSISRTGGNVNYSPRDGIN